MRPPISLLGHSFGLTTIIIELISEAIVELKKKAVCAIVRGILGPPCQCCYPREPFLHVLLPMKA